MYTLDWFRTLVGRRTSETSPSPFGRWLDGLIVSVEPNRFVVEYLVREEMTNPTGILHGGATAGMFDDVFGMVAASMAGPRLFVTVNLHVDYLEAAFAGDRLVLDCRLVRGGVTLANLDASLAREGVLVARASTNMVARRTPANGHA